MNELAARKALCFKNIVLLAALGCFLFSCTVVRDYPKNKPFVYQTNIHLEGDLSNDTRADLISQLNQQLHDSIVARRQRKLIGFDYGLKALYSVIKTPPVYDSLNASQSKIFMGALMHSLGHYRDSIWYKNTIDTIYSHGSQFRTVVDFYVRTGKQFKIDSVSIDLNDSATKAANPEIASSFDTLQALSPLNESLFQKGAPFSKPLISQEFDRLTNVYRNNGYLRFSREHLLALWDTVGLALLRPTIDPGEQAELFAALQKRRENPVADITIRLRNLTDTTSFVRYHVGNITVFPEQANDVPDNTLAAKKYKDITIRSNGNMFKPWVFSESIYMHPGQLYDQRKQNQTTNRFNSLSAWRLVIVDAVPRGKTDTVDFVMRLTPATKYYFNVNLEGSQNLGGIFTSGNIVGINFSLQNRNFAHRAYLSNTTVGFGIEIGSGNLTQTKQISLGHTIYFPKYIPIVPFKPFILKKLFSSFADNPTTRTSLAFNARYINRYQYLDLLSVNGSWGYDFSVKNALWTIRFPNIEYAYLKRGSILNELIKTNQSYKYLFNDGLVLSSVISRASSKVKYVTGSTTKVKYTRTIRLGLEPSGLLAGFINTPFLKNDLKRFVKADASWQKTIDEGYNNALAVRVLGGIGYSIPYNSTDSGRLYMPFFRAFYAGGANSMRGWGLRKLGPGSTIKSFAREDSPDRFGDVQLEGNVEWRFKVTEIGGIPVNMAAFADAGNVWLLRKNDNFPNGEFQWNRFLNDIAVDGGLGLRLDFGLLKLRVDYAWKFRDPSPADPAAQYKWFYNIKPLNGTVQLGIDYPF